MTTKEKSKKQEKNIEEFEQISAEEQIYHTRKI